MASGRRERAGSGWSVLLGVTAVAIAGGPGQGRAESLDRCQRNIACKVHSDKGIGLSERKAYAEALAEFQAAYEAEPVPRLLLNIGRSLYRLDRPQEALDYYSRYRREEKSLDAEAEKTLRRYELDALMASAVGPGESAAGAAPPSRSSSRLPIFPLATLGASLGLFVIGIGLGAGAAAAGNELSQRPGPFVTFGPNERAIEQRGLNLQTAGAAFDVMGLIALTASATSFAYIMINKKTTSPYVPAALVASPAAGR